MAEKTDPSTPAEVSGCKTRDISPQKQGQNLAAVRKKTRRVANKNRNSTGSTHGFVFHCNYFILNFIKSSPEHLGQMEQELRELAAIDVQNNKIYVKALTSGVENTWKQQCHSKLHDFLSNYATRRVRVSYLQKIDMPHLNVKQDTASDGHGYFVTITGLAKDAAKALYKIQGYDRKPMQCREQMTIRKEYHKRLIGKNGQKIKELRTKHQVDIVIPPDQSKSTTIWVVGYGNHVKEAKNDIMKFISGLSTQRDDRVQVNVKINPDHASRITADSENKIFAKTGVTLQKSTGDEVTLHGHPVKLDEAKQLLQDLLSATTDEDLDVPGWLLKYMGQELSDARAKWKEVALSFGEEKITLSGHPNEVGSFASLVRRKVEELSAKYVLDIIDVPKPLHGSIIGKAGRKVQDLKLKYQVEVTVPNSNCDSTEVKVEGEKSQVAAAISDIQQFVKNLENNFKKDITVPEWLMKYVEGKDGSGFRDVERDFPGVRIKKYKSNISLSGLLESVMQAEKVLRDRIKELEKSMKYVSESLTLIQLVALVGLEGKGIRKMRDDFEVEMGYMSQPALIYMEGVRGAVEEAHSYVKSRKENLGSFVVLEVKIDRSHFGKLIGKGGRNLQALLQNVGIGDIAIPKLDRPNDNVVVTGDKIAVEELLTRLSSQFGACTLGYTSNRMPYPRQWHSYQSANRRQKRQGTPVRRHAFGSSSNLSTASSRSPTPSDTSSLTNFSFDNLDREWECEAKVKVVHKWIDTSGCLLSFIKESAKHLQLCKEALNANSQSGRFDVNGEIVIEDEIFESKSETEWAKGVEAEFAKFLGGYSVQKMNFPPNSSAPMIDETGEDLHITWSKDKKSVTILGVRSRVDEKVMEFDTIKSRKKKVSYRWECQDNYVMKFLRMVPLHHAKLISVLEGFGSASVCDGNIVEVTGEIPEIVSSEKWANDCKHELDKFMECYSSQTVEVPSVCNIKRKDEIEEEYIVEWIHDQGMVVIYGSQCDVNLKLEVLRQKVQQSQNSHNEEIPSEEASAPGVPDTAWSAASIFLKCSPPKSKCIMECLTSEPKLANVTVTVANDGIVLTGNQSDIEDGRAYLDSFVAEEVVFQRYGVHEFFMHNKLHLDIIRTKSRCEILIEKIGCPEEEDDVFTCIHSEDKLRSKTFENLDVVVEEGDITREDVDMIVNTTDKSFSLSGPLSQAILNKAGHYVRVEVQSAIAIIPHSPSFVMTSGGKLPCKSILHVPIPDRHQSMSSLVTDILEKAESESMKTLTVPTIGAGNGGWGSDKVAREINTGILEFLKKNPYPTNLRKVKVILFPMMPSQDKKNFHNVLGVEVEPDTKVQPATSEGREGSLLTKFFSSIFGSRTVKPTATTTATSADNPPAGTSSTDDSSKNVKSQKTMSGESAKIIFMSDDMKNLENAKKEVSHFVDLHLKELTLTDDVIAKLTNVQRNSIRDVAIDKKVKIILNQKRGDQSIVIQGGVEFASEAYNEVKKIIDTLAKGLPTTWTAMPKSEKYRRVQLDCRSSEYLDIETRFTAANRRAYSVSFTVQSVERIQNPGLYRQYQLEKEHSSPRISDSTIERMLFHGTSADTVDRICKDGFNRSYAGKNATAYGKGVYFSTESSYSDAYSSTDHSGRKQMFLANVITGDYCTGNPSMVEPPVNHRTSEKYNSVTDRSFSPSIFVVFKDASVYPAYVIMYTTR